MSTPSGRYPTIVADPPWHYDGFAQRVGAPHRWARENIEASRLKQGNITTRPLPYPSMSVDEIAHLPIGDLADDDARLFLWATNRYLPDAFSVCASWGFAYRQLLVWDKSPNVNPLGGSVAPNACEFLLVAVRGKPARIGRWNSSLVRARKHRSFHSAKPDAFLDLIETVSPGPYLELFARRQRLGWDTWGNEALDHVEVLA